MKNKIIEIAFIRNHLLSSIFTEEDKKLMEKVKQDILESDTPFKEIAIFAITNCEYDISRGNLKAAGYEMNLIHNFCFCDAKTWDSDYFYTMELSSYFDKTEGPIRIKKLIYELAKLQDKLAAN